VPILPADERPHSPQTRDHKWEAPEALVNSVDQQAAAAAWLVRDEKAAGPWPRGWKPDERLA
jgi:hypothetical protein